MMDLFNIKVTIRNARKDKILSFAKLFGLSISFTVVFFTAGYVYYEFSFDRNITDYKKIYRCIMYGKLNGSDEDFAVTSSQMAEAVTNDVPEIIEAIRLSSGGERTMFYNGEVINLGHVYFADSNFCSFFGFEALTEAKDLFTSENSVAISKSIADKHFKSARNAIGKKVKIQGEDYFITGIFNDFPKNFHLQTNLIGNIRKTKPDEVDWGSQNYFTYIKTNDENINLEDLNLRLTKTVYTHYDDRIDGAGAENWEDLKYHAETYMFFAAEPLADIHFGKHKFDPVITSNKTYVYGAMVFAFLVLLVSSINFINLSIANLSTRFREFGIRKTIGARNRHITLQILTESLFFWLVGIIIAFFLYQFIVTPLSNFLDAEIGLSVRGLVGIISLSLILILGVNLITILIPLAYFSRKNALYLIENEHQKNRNITLKGGFVVLQFVLSFLIILSSVIVQKQLNYMLKKDRGYDSDNVIVLSMWEIDPEKRKTIIEELKTYPIIRYVSTSNAYLGADPGMSGAFFETEDDQNFFHTSVFPVDYDFLNTYNLELKEGRFFEKGKESDFRTVLLNETASKEYSGNAESLIGMEIIVDGRKCHIIGIVKDFHFRSFYHRLQPLVISQTENQGNINIKFRNDQLAEVLEILHEKWIEYEISSPFNYELHNEVLAAQYEKDKKARRLLSVLSIISIAIACIGLYAISYFVIVKKTKEIGIRKVNGATTSTLLFLINKDFLIWIVLAFVIACPVVFYFATKWLENFAYKTNLNWWVFMLTGFGATSIAILTISWQSWRAANRNPVEALRYE